MTELLQITALAVFVGLTSAIVFTVTSILKRRKQQPLLGVVMPQTPQDAVSAPKTTRKVK